MCLPVLVEGLSRRPNGWNWSGKRARRRGLIRSTNHRPATADLINFFFQQGSVRCRNLECVHTRVVAHDKAEIGGPDYMFHEQAGGRGLLVKNPGHTCAGIEKHANVEHHVALVGKESNGLLLPSFEHPKFSPVKLARELLLVIAHGEVYGNPDD